MNIKNIKCDSEEWDHGKCKTLEDVKKGLLNTEAVLAVNFAFKYNDTSPVYFEDEDGNKYTAEIALPTVKVSEGHNPPTAWTTGSGINE